MPNQYYRIYNEDCFDTFQRIKDGSIDMVMCDPPYGTTACSWDSVIPLEPMWKQLKRIVKSNGAIVFTASQPFTTKLISSNYRMFKYCWVWEKEQGTGFARAKEQPLRKHEDVLVFYGKLPYYDSVGETLDKPRIVNRRSNSNNGSFSDCLANADSRTSIYTHTSKHTILMFSRDNQCNHPTQKPIGLMEYLIKTYTDKGERVLDFAMGSGTTGEACGNLCRRFVGCDNDVDHGYFEIAQARIKSAYRFTSLTPKPKYKPQELEGVKPL